MVPFLRLFGIICWIAINAQLHFTTRVLEISGGAERIALTMMRRFGEKRAPWALGPTGIVVAIPVFFDAGLIILIPLAFSIAKRAKKSTLFFVIPLLAGLAVGHAFIPPTPGPVLVANILGVDLGLVIGLGLVCGLVAMICAGPIFGRYCGKKYDIPVPAQYLNTPEFEESKLPSFASVVGIIIPHFHTPRRFYSQQAESQTTEVKAAHDGCPTKLRDTLSSFSNQNSGGILLFGLDERKDFQAVGVYDLQDLQKKVTEQCNQMYPPVRALFTTAEYQGVWICSAEIPALPYAERPCYYSGAGIQNGSYIRVGDADRRMTDAQAMEMLSITHGGIPTIAGLLNFCDYPQGFLPELGITAVVVPGTEIGTLSASGARFIDNKRIEGTIANMFSEAMAFCMRNMKTETIIDLQTGRTNLL